MRVRLFAALREMAGTSWLEDERASNVDDLLRSLGDRFGPEFERVARAGAAVVGGEPVEVGTTLAQDDEVTLLPPVSGGSAAGYSPRPARPGWSRSTTTSPPGWRAASGTWMPHSTFCEPDQRPARSSSPGKTTRVQGAQPIDA
jgi:molybdopterin converting factor small subunit